MALRREIHAPLMKHRLMSFSIDGTSTGVKEVSQVICVADIAASLDGKHFLLSSSSTDYYVWLNVDGADNDPEVASRTGIEVAISSGDADTAVATAVAAALEAHAAFSASAASATVTVTNAADGAASDADAADSGFTVSTPTQGVSSSISLDGEGKFDATLSEGANAGEYTLTWREPLGRAPVISANSKTASVVIQLSASSASACTLKCFAADGTTPKDADLHVLVLGSEAPSAT